MYSVYLRMLIMYTAYNMQHVTGYHYRFTVAQRKDVVSARGADIGRHCSALSIMHEPLLMHYLTARRSARHHDIVRWGERRWCRIFSLVFWYFYCVCLRVICPPWLITHHLHSIGDSDAVVGPSGRATLHLPYCGHHSSTFLEGYTYDLADIKQSNSQFVSSV